MGNVVGKGKSKSNGSVGKISDTPSSKHRKVSNGVKHQTFETGVSNSFRSFNSVKQNGSFGSISRPWSRISRRKWNEKTLLDPLSCSKTAWPVPHFESLFLPEFKIRNESTDNPFQIVGTISSGAYGRVHKVSKAGTNQIYAMKILSKAQIVGNNLVDQVKEEVKIQKLVGHHPFIVDCLSYWQSRKQLYIVSEYVPGGELLKLLEERGPLPVDVVRVLTAQLAVTIDFLHNAGIIYRDLKLENILLDSKGRIQLIDFGLSKWLKYGMRTNTICGTLQYIAPEVLQGKPYGHAVDWWSLGIVVLVMSTGKWEWREVGEDRGEEGEVQELLEGLLVEDPVRRMRSLWMLKRRRLFRGFEWEKVTEMGVDVERMEVVRVGEKMKRDEQKGGLCE